MWCCSCFPTQTSFHSPLAEKDEEIVQTYFFDETPEYRSWSHENNSDSQRTGSHSATGTQRCTGLANVHDPFTKNEFETPEAEIVTGTCQSGASAKKRIRWGKNVP